MTVVVWPQRADSTCTACRERHVVVTVYSDGSLLCAGCQQMPSRRADYRTAEEIRDAA